MRVSTFTCVIATVLIGATACTENDNSSDATAIKVSSTADACEVSATEAPSGRVEFEVTNNGSEATEFYLLTADGGVAGEVENIGPGLTRNLVVDVSAGDYFTSCKPGMVGDGIRAPFSVTDADK